MIILVDEELCQSIGTFVLTRVMNIQTVGDTLLYSMGTQFVWCLTGL